MRANNFRPLKWCIWDDKEQNHTINNAGPLIWATYAPEAPPPKKKKTKKKQTKKKQNKKKNILRDSANILHSLQN